MASDSATAVSSQQALKAYVAAQIAAIIASDVTLSAYTDEDFDSNTMLKDHAYKAATGGMVFAYSLTIDEGENLNVFVGTTNDPVGAGTLIQTSEGATANNEHSIGVLVAEDEYFEIECNKTPIILWKSFGTLSKPVDQD